MYHLHNSKWFNLIDMFPRYCFSISWQYITTNDHKFEKHDPDLLVYQAERQFN